MDRCGRGLQHFHDSRAVCGVLVRWANELRKSLRLEVMGVELSGLGHNARSGADDQVRQLQNTLRFFPVGKTIECIDAHQPANDFAGMLSPQFTNGIDCVGRTTPTQLGIVEHKTGISRDREFNHLLPLGGTGFGMVTMHRNMAGHEFHPAQCEIPAYIRRQLEVTAMNGIKGTAEQSDHRPAQPL